MLRQNDWVTFTCHNRTHNRLASHAGDVAEDTFELNVHLLQGLLHMQNMGRTMANQFGSVAYQRTQCHNLAIGTK